MNPRTWFRRNRWGLVALIPAITMALAIPVQDFHSQRWAKQPHDRVTAGSDGSVNYNHARMTLVTLFKAAGLRDFAGEPIAIPPGSAVWQAKLRLQTSTPNAVGSCSMYLATEDGSTYDADPSELNEAGLSMDDLPFCEAGTDLNGKPLNDWTLTLFFLTPAQAKPIGLQINADRELPRYALIKRT